MKIEHLPPNEGKSQQEEMHEAMYTLRGFVQSGIIDLYDRESAFHLAREWGYDDLMYVANDQRKFNQAVEALEGTIE